MERKKFKTVDVFIDYNGNELLIVLSSVLKPGFTWAFMYTDRLTRHGMRKKCCQYGEGS